MTLDGKMKKETFENMTKDIEEELLWLESERKDTTKKTRKQLDVIKQMVELANKLENVYKEADETEKIRLLRFFFNKIWVKDKKISKVEFNEVWNEIYDINVRISSGNLPGTDIIRTEINRIIIGLIEKSILKDKEKRKQSIIFLN